MSARLSVTVMTSVETRLKAATATISARIRKSMRFWICTDSNHWRFVRVQSRTNIPGRVRQPGRASSPATSRSARRSCNAAGPLAPKSACASAQHQGQRAVVLEVAGLEGAGHRQRHHARRAAGARRIGQHQRDTLAAFAPSWRASSAPSSTSPRPGLQPPAACRAVAARDRTPRPRAPGRCRAPAPAAARRRARAAPARRRRAPRRPPAGGAARLRRGGAPVGQRAALGVVDLHVGDHREHAVAHLLAEAVHHRQHDDQRRHAQRDAEHGHRRDEGDEAVVVAAARPARR